ncbi:YadA C-terminal domain-containing protein [Providencia sp.]|uniref:YadA C-terminal domain-containing protein n=1 Tax=Providencia sp. TaxID=589 RepID=UPI003F98ABED
MKKKLLLNSITITLLSSLSYTTIANPIINNETVLDDGYEYTYHTYNMPTPSSLDNLKNKTNSSIYSKPAPSLHDFKLKTENQKKPLYFNGLNESNKEQNMVSLEITSPSQEPHDFATHAPLISPLSTTTLISTIKDKLLKQEHSNAAIPTMAIISTENALGSSALNMLLLEGFTEGLITASTPVLPLTPPAKFDTLTNNINLKNSNGLKNTIYQLHTKSIRTNKSVIETVNRVNHLVDEIKNTNKNNHELNNKIEANFKNIDKEISNNKIIVTKIKANAIKTQKTNDKKFTAFESKYDNAVNQLDNKIDQRSKEANSGIASVAAMSNIPYATNTRFSAGVGAGNYKNGTAIAAGAQYQLKENVNLRSSISWNNSDSAVMGAGIAFGW